MSTYIDLLAAHDMKRHDHLIIKTKPIIKGNNVIIEFEEDCIISNCYYFKNPMYGLWLVPVKIEYNTVTFKVYYQEGNLSVTDIEEINTFEVGDKLEFNSIIGFRDFNKRSFKYAEL